MAVVSCIVRRTRDPSSLIAAFTTVFAFHAFAAAARAQAPAGYYDGVDASNPAALRSSLHAAIDDHTRIPYTSTATDTWNVLELADEDPNDPNRILDVYKNASYAKVGAGNTNYDREHTWPKSYGFPNDVTSNYPYTDCHMLFLCDASYNGARSNRPYAEPGATATEYVTLVNDGFGGGSGLYPGNSNWGTGSFDAGSWEVWGHRRGDVARALLYMDIRYEGGNHTITGHAEPNLVLTDDRALIAASNTGANISLAYMGELSVLLSWHADDPVDDRERYRNDVVYAFQGNRNPFVDHPEWVACLFDANCGGGDIVPPAPPTGLGAVAGNARVDLDWNDGAEPDLVGYDVYRASASGGPFTKVNGVLVGASSYADTTVVNGTTYYYRVTAVDGATNASLPSSTVTATPVAPPASALAWINEIHYDNTGTDKNEAIEIAGVAGTNLAGWRLIAYNGSGGADYATKTLSGTIPSQQGGKGTVKVTFAGLQNGAPDGIALVDASNVVVEFLSYEGVFTATTGPAAGLTAQAIATSETESTPSNYSLQRGGSGNGPEDFTWQVAKKSTFAAVNSGQTLTP